MSGFKLLRHRFIPCFEKSKESTKLRENLRLIMFIYYIFVLTRRHKI
nr:MAG TPA: hypothetical protein [Caudoviricetes sp.]